MVQPLGRACYRVIDRVSDAYVVIVNPQGPLCDCRGFRFRHRCWHIAAVEAHQMAAG